MLKFCVLGMWNMPFINELKWIHKRQNHTNKEEYVPCLILIKWLSNHPQGMLSVQRETIFDARAQTSCKWGPSPKPHRFVYNFCFLIFRLLMGKSTLYIKKWLWWSNFLTSSTQYMLRLLEVKVDSLEGEQASTVDKKGLTERWQISMHLSQGRQFPNSSSTA